MIYEIKTYGITKVRYLEPPKSGQELRHDRRKAERKVIKGGHGSNKKNRR